ncbi:hypothetical protein DHEL01_v203909 [Diaporthe helianthi]|uniref:Uncharacterized protein n=1 Tax=Diaporthe helianthi TaxID=158607 RepID=A0A2P5I5G8_DIAHE|nr:hypothetical protein DHEL01_v203909 [Diaporthe helianthi]
MGGRAVTEQSVLDWTELKAAMSEREIDAAVPDRETPSTEISIRTSDRGIDPSKGESSGPPRGLPDAAFYPEDSDGLDFQGSDVELA